MNKRQLRTLVGTVTGHFSGNYLVIWAAICQKLSQNADNSLNFESTLGRSLDAPAVNQYSYHRNSNGNCACNNIMNILF
jgi:hypothetical protein